MKKTLLLPVLILLTTLVFGQNVRIGDILCTDGNTVRPEQFAASGKTAEGIVFYIDNTGTQGWAVNLNIDALDTDWVTETHYGDGYDIPDLPNCELSRQALYDMDGYQNTAIIRATYGPDWYPAAWAVDFDNGWYLPAAGQMRWLLAYVNEINTSLRVVGGRPFVLPYPDWHWTSTEYGSMHAVIVSRIGSVSNYMKWNYYYIYTIGVRAIKNFECNSTPEHKIGDVITTASGQKGIVFYVSPDDGSYWLTALNDLPGRYSWGNNQDITELDNIADEMNQWYGMQGIYCGYDATMHMRDAQGNNNAYAANHVDLENGWHIPSTGQLSKLYAALPHIEEALLGNGGSLPSGDLYWTSTENTNNQAWAIDFGSNEHLYQEGRFVATPKQTQCKVRSIWSESCLLEPPTVGSIDTPEPICANEILDLQEPETHHATSHGWQLSPTPDFGSPMEYNGEPIGFDHNGWYLRYFAYNQSGTVYSNSVCISVWPSYATSFNITSCTPYVWNGITYSEPGSYTQTLPSIYGCDSVVTLNLTFDSINKREVFLTGCDEITFNGVTYNQSGNYQQIIHAITGCDTIVELYLNIGHSPYVGQIHGESLIYYQTNGTYTYSIDPVSGSFGYEWSIDGPWSIDTSPDTPECTVNINSPGTAMLKVRVYTECGYIERTLFINHDARPDIVIYPNPTKGEFNIVLYGMQGEAVIVVYDYLGQFIDRFSVDTDLEGTIVPYSLAGKAAGVYLINVMNHYEKVTKKVIKETASSHGTFFWGW